MAKSFYKISEVSRLLDVPEHTLRYWEQEFDELSPARVCNQRRYGRKDIEVLRRIMDLLYNRKYRIEAAKEYLHGYRKHKPRKMPKCKSKSDAENLLLEVMQMTDNEHILVRIESVESWIAETEVMDTPPMPAHKNIRGKEYFTQPLRNQTDSES